MSAIGGKADIAVGQNAEAAVMGKDARQLEDPEVEDLPTAQSMW